MSQVIVRDVCPRDGLQDIKEFIPSDTKIELVEKLGLVGVPAVEVTSFVSPKVIPQLADAEAVVSGLITRGGAREGWSAFVATTSGLIRALESGITDLATTVPATDKMTEANFRRSREEMLTGVLGLNKEAPDHVKTSVTVAVAFGCPFEGRVATSDLLDLVDRLAAGGYRSILFGDTIGVANPVQVASVVRAVTSRFPEIQIGGHFHDSRGAGIANVVAAVESGATVIDASVGGLGGCPFAPGAAGNVATEDVVWLLESMGFATGVDIEGIVELARWIRATLGISARSRTPEAVRFAWESNEAANAA